MDIYKFFFLAFFLAHGIVHGQSDTLNQVDKDGLKQGYWIIRGADKPEKEYCDTCRIEEGPYKDGRKEGLWTKYHKNGNVRLQGYYKQNRPHSFHHSGGYPGYQSDGLMHERSGICFGKGSPCDTDTLNCIKDGKKEGYWITYGIDRPNSGYCDTCIYEQGIYLQGRKKGLWKRYHKNGNLKLVGTYERGRPAGDYQKFYETGAVMEEGRFIKGKNLGPFKKYFECGNVWVEKNYNENGKEHGQTAYYFNNCGCPDSTSQIPEITFNKVNGITVGRALRYYHSGCLKERIEYDSAGVNLEVERFKDECGEDTYRNNHPCNYGLVHPDPSPPINPPRIQPPIFDPNGFNKVYDPNDELIYDGLFKNGKLYEGKWFRYDSDGILMRIEIWKKGSYFADGQL